MTALVVALGLLSIAIGSAEAGHEVEGPMAIVILRRPGDVDRAEPARPADAGATVWESSEASA
jgi:hypothetical protein